MNNMRGILSKQGCESTTWEVVTINLIIVVGCIISAGQCNGFGMVEGSLKEMIYCVVERLSPMEIGFLKTDKMGI